MLSSGHKKTLINDVVKELERLKGLGVIIEREEKDYRSNRYSILRINDGIALVSI